MSKSKTLFTVLLLTVIAAVVPVASAQVVHVQAAGSSALFQPMEVAAVNDISVLTTQCGGVGGVGVTCDVHHFSVKSACPGVCAAQLTDSRTNAGIGPIPNEPGNLWVVWVTNHTTGAVTDVWADISVDSTVGVRTLLSRPNSGAAQSANNYLISSAVESNAAFQGANAVNPALLKYGVNSASTGCGALTTCDDQFLPATVFAAINGKPMNTGLTDIRPEDAKWATKRTAGPISGGSLGYGSVGSQLLVQAIHSAFTAAIATPVEFGLIGSTDPISLKPVPATIAVTPVGQSPIVFIANRKNAAGLGALEAPLTPAFADLNDNLGVSPNPLSDLFSGDVCKGSSAALRDNAGTASLTAAGIADFPLSVIQREPLSGTMNTTEFTEFRTNGGTNAIPGSGTWNVNPWTLGTGSHGGSQEFNVDPSAANNNPLHIQCNTAVAGNGFRMRAIGTGEEVSGVLNGGLADTGTDAIGYSFFSFGNISSIANSANYGYFTIDHVDPLFIAYNGTGGDPGQPADSTGANLTNGKQEWGVLPVCTPGGTAAIPNCTKAAIWKGGASFPHLVDGTYRAWSLLRMLCDTADAHCSKGVDALGAQGLVAAAQADIDAGTGVPDFLPYADIKFVRSHGKFQIFAGSIKSAPFLHFTDPPSATTLDTPATALEEGGDAGGCILPLATEQTQLTITSFAAGSASQKVTYSNVPTVAPLAGDQISIINATNGGNNGVFSIVSVGPAAGVIRINNTGGVAEAASSALGSSGTPLSATVTPVNCWQ